MPSVCPYDRLIHIHERIGQQIMGHRKRICRGMSSVVGHYCCNFTTRGRPMIKLEINFFPPRSVSQFHGIGYL